MRTWSVSGTAFALCTTSSSLSMSTSTSMGAEVYWLLGRILRRTRPPVREKLPETARYRLWDELLDIAAESGDFLDAARRHEADLRARHHVDRLDLGCECAVQLVHLEFPFEVRDHAKTLHDHLCVPLQGALH